MKPGLLIMVGVGLAVVIGLVVFLDAQFPGTLQDSDNQLDLVYKLAILAAVIGSLAVGFTWQNFGFVARSMLAWAALGFLLVLGYSYWDEIAPVGRRMAATLVPAQPSILATGMVALRADSAGHFRTIAEVEGQRVQFMIDTGASDIALTQNDARRIGIDVERLLYNIPYSTANGVAFGAGIRLGRVTVGDITIQDIGGHVVQGDRLDQSLLGMSFLRRLGGFEVRGTEMILRQ